MKSPDAADLLPSEAIAIIGIGCRFPGGADSPEAFWRLLKDGFNAVKETPASRPGFNELFDADPRKPGRTYSRWGGFLERVDLFDAQFFGISPREAVHIDPQHRLLLELVWEACEDAGLPPSKLEGSRTGVFIGISTHDYGDAQMYPQHRADIDMHTNSGTATSIAANRISYLYDLRGPSVAIDTACSSALSAVHFACQGLRSGDCSLAIAGGVQLLLAPELSIGFCKASMLSKDGECRAFDTSANGYVRSEGSGVVLLKPLEDAIAAGDPIYAVIRATAVNQDGHTNGMTVPSSVAQQAMIEEALAKAHIHPRDVQYVETHGTGTQVGDPIEAKAVGLAMSTGREDGEFCAIGSVKTNIGHLEAASGIAGLIKVALALKHRQLPPSLHFHQANAAIDLDALKLRVVTKLEPWPASEGLPTAGVNSFGFGGANAHAVLQASLQEQTAQTEETAMARLFAVSAKTPEALQELAKSYADDLRNPDEAPALRDICHTASERRAHHEFRLAITAGNKEDLAAGLEDFISGTAGANMVHGRVQTGARLAFVFAGMGPQWWGMGRQLRKTEPVFRTMLERCDEILRPYSGWSLLEEFSRDESTSRVASPELAQVTNFALQVALADLWASWGIRPDAVIGHSGGAMAAAFIAGVHSLEDSLRLTFHRSRLQGRPANSGGMLAVGAPFEEIEPMLAGKEHLVSLAAVNGPSAITLAGDRDTIDELCAALQQRQIFARVLAVTIAYHSPAMDKIRDEFLAAVPGLQGQKAALPFLSDTTGTWASGAECDVQYWWRAIRQPVLFHKGIEEILRSGVSNFVEISPHPVLVSAIVECMKSHGVKGLAVPSIRRTEDERAAMLRSLGALYTIGRTPDWSALREAGARLVRLPHYAWQRQRHWFEPSAATTTAMNLMERKAGDHPLLGARLRSARPVWENAAGIGATEYLQGHIVQGSPVYPGAAYVEMALAARRAMDPASGVVLHDIEFVKTLVLNRASGTAIQFAFDPDDGRFEIFSSATSDESPWMLHSRGTATAVKSTRGKAIDLDAARGRITHAVPTGDFYATMAERGLGYGPEFRGIDQLWASDAGEALALVALDDLTDCADYCVHPALLDAAFQVIVAGADANVSTTAPRRLFLPTRIREFSFHAPPGERFWVIAKVTDRTASAVTAEIAIVAEDGTPCIEIEGFTARLIDAAGQAAHESIDNWLYDYQWEPAAPLTAATTPVAHLPSVVECDAIRLRADELAAESGWQLYYGEVEARLNELAAAYIAEASISPDAIAAGSWRHSLAAQCLEILQVIKPSGAQSAATLGENLLRDFPAHRLDVELLGMCGPRLADVLAGRMDGRDVLFSAANLPVLERFYRESPASAFYNALTADRVADFASSFNAARPLRILEVGAGTGGTTSLILPRLDPAAATYVFSDVSPVFLERANAKFASQYPFVSTQLFDVTRDTALSGLEPGSFDLILAANVLHATPRVAPCVARLRELLAPGGALMLLEITRHPLWLDIVFGQMDGWWKFEDRERRPHHPLMTGASWCDLLAECALEAPTVIADSAPGEAAQSIILASRGVDKSEAKTKRWLIFADNGGVALRLAEALAGISIDTELVYAADADLSSWDKAASASFDGIVHLCSLDVPALGDSSAGDLPFADALKLGCASVLSILRRVTQGTPLAQRDFVLVTAGAQAARVGEEPALLQAPLWGLGRVIRKELPGLRCRMLDLSAACSDEEILGLAHEIAADADGSDVWEEEVALRGGERFVHRLRPITLNGIADAAPPIIAGPEDEWHAEIGATGSFDSIVLRRTERSEPGPLEVEVAISAAGLNFRDVVLGMGAVAGLEAQESFGSRRLGFDLAGTISKVGAEVSGLRPGDQVFGIARGAFASYALANAALIVPRPSHITPQQASSIPVAFVTAHYALRYLAHLSRGETVLIHVASGGVGVAAIQMAKRIGARIFATAGSEAKRRYVASLGVEAVMDSRSLSFADEVLALTGGRGVDVILNSLAGEAIDKGIAALAPYGRFLELGKSDIYQNHRLQLLPFKKNLSFFAVDLDRMCFERTEFVSKLLHEVAEELRSGLLEPPPCTEFPMQELAGAMRFMAQARHIGKIVVTNHTPPAVRDALPESPPIRADATYLITGGMGGVGLLTARFLIERGARSIVLVGRTVPVEAEAQLEKLRNGDVRVQALAADVSKAADVSRVAEFIRTELPPLRGILHAAMVLDDLALGDLDDTTMHAVMAPKMAGAWNLHRHTRGDNLDFFVCFSSITSLLGNPLQGNYASANAFLDSFAIYRRALGLKATTINWGVIAGSGYVARHPEIEEALNRQGYQSFTEPQVMQVLSELMRHDACQIMAARIDWRRLAEFAPGAAQSPRIRHLIPAAASEGVQHGMSSIRTLLATEDAASRPAKLEQYLREKVARLLGASPAAIDSMRAITDLGLDSLIATELTVVLERDLNVQIAGTRLLSGISIHALAGELAMQLWPDAKPEESPAVVEAVEAPRADPAAPIDLPVRELPHQPQASAIPPPAAVLPVTGTAAKQVDRPVNYASLNYRRWTFGQQVVRKVTAAGFQLLSQIDAQGLENIPESGPCLLAVNHLSMADVPLVLTLLPRRAVILANDRLRDSRLIDWFISDMGQAIYVKRNQAEEEPLERALEVLNAGGLLALAPEGTRSKTGGLLRGNTGVAYLATHADVPVVPLVAWGQERWRERGSRAGRIPIHVRVGAPMRFPQGHAEPADVRRYTDQIMCALASMLPAEYRGVYADTAAGGAFAENPAMGRDR